MSESATLKIFSSVVKMRGEGIDVTSLCVGEPDFPPPREVISATVKAAEEGMTKYTGNAGILSLREAIADDLKKRKGVAYAPDEILVSNGAKQSCFQAIFATVAEGDKVIIPSPYYPSYPEMVKLLGGIPVILDTKIENDYKVTANELEECLAKNGDAKLLIFCNPSNPTGVLHTQSDLEAIARVLKDSKFEDINVLTDEIYERWV